MARKLRYRGRGRIRRTLTVFLVFLVTLLVLAVVLFFWLRNYAEYTPDGKVYLNCAIIEGWREPTPVPDITMPPPSAQPPPPETTPPPTPTPEPTTEPKTQQKLHALYAPINVLSNEGAMEIIKDQLARGEADTLVLEIKAADSTLAYPSSQPAAIQANICVQDDNAIQLIRELKASGVYVVARISCFKDGYLPGVVRSVGIKTSNGETNWLEGGTNTHTRWLDPYKLAARDYLLGVLSEVAAMDVDEILLDWLTFPTQGKVTVINYGAFADAPRYEAIESFAREARETVASSGAALSVVVFEEACLNGEDTAGGQRLPALVGLFDRLYLSVPVSTETGTEFEALTERLAGLIPGTEWPARIVPMLPVAGNLDPDALRIALDAAGGQTGCGWMLENSRGEYPELGG